MSNKTLNACLQSAPSAKTVISVDEAAARLGVSPSSVRRKIKEGELAARKFGARVLVPVAEIERVLTGDTE